MAQKIVALKSIKMKNHVLYKKKKKGSNRSEKK